jgi:hypothetical protein
VLAAQGFKLPRGAGADAALAVYRDAEGVTSRAPSRASPRR